MQLSKSNATHVYLWQVTPHSEATYKCEISADSPSFKTVSAERQLKVYILPKRKLSIVVNSNNNNSNQNTVHSSSMESYAPQGSPMAPSQYSMSHYNLNDVINMTCIMGPSKPVASLRWFVNDLPVESGSQWLTLRHYNDAGQQVSSSDSVANTKATFGGPVETHLTIAFQLQASHLFMQQHQHRHLKPSNPHRNKLSNANGGGGGRWLVQLRCVAHLGVEFASETSIKLADGKTVVKTRRQDAGGSDSAASASALSPTTSSILPQPSSQVRTPQLLVSSGDPASLQDNNNRNYRPKSPTRATQTTATSAQSLIDIAYKWPPVRLPQVTATSDSWSAGAGTNDKQSPVVLVGPPASGNQRSSTSQLLVVVWTNRQIKAQSDHIEQLLMRTRPNQLEPPIIEASMKASASKSFDTTDQGEGEGDSEPGVELQPGDNETAYVRNWRHSSLGESSVPDEPGDTEASDHEPERRVDLFEFTCVSRLNSPERDLLKDVRLVWLLNNKQVRGDRVNAFDGSVFYHSQDPKGRQQTRLNDTSGNISSTRLAKHRYPVVVGRRNGQQQHPLVASEQKKSTLLIELSPALMQLKELDLKCRTVFVQPLIEFETIAQSVVAVSAAAAAATTSALPNSPTSPFIHASVERDGSSPGGPVLFNSNSNSNNQQDQSALAGRDRVTNMRAPNGHYQRRNPLLATKNNNSENNSNAKNHNSNNRPSKHWTSVIRPRQPSASSSSKSLSSDIDPQHLYYVCLGHFLLNFIVFVATYIFI